MPSVVPPSISRLSPLTIPWTGGNPYTAQLLIARQGFKQAQTHETVIVRDREELMRLQHEVNEIRSRQQTLTPVIYQPISQPGSQEPPWLYTPSPSFISRASLGTSYRLCPTAAESGRSI